MAAFVDFVLLVWYIDCCVGRHGFALNQYANGRNVRMRKSIILLAVMLVAVCVSGMQSSAQTGVASATITAPPNGATITGNQVDIAVNFSSAVNQPISKVQVFLDGKQITERVYQSPMVNGTCTFRWDTMRTPNGKHRLDIPVFSGSDYVAMATCVIAVSNTAADLAGPKVIVVSPKNGQVVSGVTSIVVQSLDDSGNEPFISVYVDKSIRSMSNHGPYVYDWDTTSQENGPHIIDVVGMDNSNNKTAIPTIKVMVRNPVKQKPLVNATTVTAPVETIATVASGTSIETPSDMAGASKVQEQARVASTTAKAQVETAEVAASATKPSVKQSSVADTSSTLKGVASKPVETPVLAGTTATVELPGTVSKIDSKLVLPAMPSVSAKPVASAPKAQTPDSAVSKPTTAPVLADNQPNLQLAAPTANDDSRSVLPAVPVAPKPVAATVVAAAPKVVLNGSVSKPTASPMLVAKLPASQMVLPSINSDAKPVVPSVKVASNPVKKIAKSVSQPKAQSAAKQVLVPIRSLFNNAGGKTYWNGEYKIVRAVNADHDVRLKIGSDKVFVDKDQVTMDKPAVIKQGHTLVPQSFVDQALQMTISGK